MKQSVFCGMVLAVATIAGQGQTRIDLRHQSRNVDFSMADSTRSFKMGTSLPASCVVGEQYFKSDATAGRNLYACTSANTWTLQGDGAGQSRSLTDLAVSVTSSTVLSVAGGVYGVDGATYGLEAMTFTIQSFSVQAVAATNPASVMVTTDLAGAVRNGDTVNITGVNGGGCAMFNGTFAVMATGARQLTLIGVNGTGCSYTGGGVVAGTGSGTAYLYGNPSGSVTLETPASSGVIVRCAGTCIVNQVTSPATAVNGVPLASVVISGGAWVAATDLRAFMRTRNLTAGTGMTMNETGGGASVSIDTALVPQLGGANVWTGSNDFSSAASFRLPAKTFFAEYEAATCVNGTATSRLSSGGEYQPVASCVTGHTNTALGVLKFGHWAVNEVHGHLLLPEDWAGTLEVRALWRAEQASGNVVWGAQAACAGQGESADPAFGTPVLATVTANTTANTLAMTTLGPVPAQGCAAGEVLFFRLYRDGPSAGDTMGGDAHLVSVRVGYSRAL